MRGEEDGGVSNFFFWIGAAAPGCTCVAQRLDLLRDPFGEFFCF